MNLSKIDEIKLNIKMLKAKGRTFLCWSKLTNEDIVQLEGMGLEIESNFLNTTDMFKIIF